MRRINALTVAIEAHRYAVDAKSYMYCNMQKMHIAKLLHFLQQLKRHLAEIMTPK